jgi:hypothetical protein
MQMKLMIVKLDFVTRLKTKKYDDLEKFLAEK